MVFLQAEDGIREKLVTGVQSCALPILTLKVMVAPAQPLEPLEVSSMVAVLVRPAVALTPVLWQAVPCRRSKPVLVEIGRAAWRGRGEVSGGGVSLKKKKVGVGEVVVTR